MRLSIQIRTQHDSFGYLFHESSFIFSLIFNIDEPRIIMEVIGIRNEILGKWPCEKIGLYNEK